MKSLVFSQTEYKNGLQNGKSLCKTYGSVKICIEKLVSKALFLSKNMLLKIKKVFLKKFPLRHL